MPSIRHLGFLLLSVLAFVVAVSAGVAGIRLCSPAPLPGDELWAWREAFETASRLALGGVTPGCYAPGSGDALLALARLGPALLMIGPLLWLAWEWIVRPLRRLCLRRSGGHVLLFGGLDDVRALARDQKKRRRIAFVTPDRREAWHLANQFPFAEVLVATGEPALVQAIDRLGGSAASLVAAISDRDLSNMAIAEHLLNAPEGKAPNIALRVEQNVVRTMRSQPLQEAADRKGSKLTVFSLSMLQLRAGLHEAMPGRFKVEGSGGYHAAICGSGPMVAQLAFLLARQGYWLEESLPRLSIMRTGFRDFAPGQIERLSGATLAVNLSADHVDPEDVASFERAATAIATAEPALHAIHCVGETHAEALALAQRWERVLLSLRVPVPPIVAYGPPRTTSASGMIRTIPDFDPRDATQAMRLADTRARTMHQHYVDTQRAAKRSAFGTQPAEVDWELLGEAFRDDNRNVADHIEYKLARLGLRAVASPDVKPFSFAAGQVDQLGRFEHGRWMAARNVVGFSYGPTRNDREHLHPDLVPFDELTQAAKDKDFEVVRSIPGLLALGGQQIEAVRGEHGATGREHWVDDDRAIEEAEKAAAAGSELLLSLGRDGREILAGGNALSRRLSALLAGAYEIRHRGDEMQPEGHDREAENA